MTVEGTTLRYAPDDGGDTVELKDALTDGEKKMVGMGTKVLICRIRCPLIPQRGR